jgi:plastocyanin
LKVRLSLGAICAALIAALVPATPAMAAQTFEIEVGRFFDETDHTAESMRFYPSAVSVVPGDTLHFSTESFHGVTLIPVGDEPEVWVADNAGPGGPWSPFQADPDEGPDAASVNDSVVSPSDLCGWPGQPACEFDGVGDEVLDALNSGLALFPTDDGGTETRQLSFEVTVTADPGTTFHAIDPLHPEMTMRIDVVGTFEERSDVFALAAESDAQFAADAAQAVKLDKQYSKKRVSKKVKGKVVWQAWAGVEQEGISLRRMYPKKLTIKRNQSVRWNFNRNIYEAHTVTFPTRRVTGLAGAFPQIVCDVGGDTDSSPDEAPPLSQFPFCAEQSDLELDVPVELVLGAGDGKVKKASDFESSPARGSAYAETDSAFQLVFTKKSAKKGYAYGCVIHEAAHAPMRAKVVVK